MLHNNCMFTQSKADRSSILYRMFLNFTCVYFSLFFVGLFSFLTWSRMILVTIVLFIKISTIYYKKEYVRSVLIYLVTKIFVTSIIFDLKLLSDKSADKR